MNAYRLLMMFSVLGATASAPAQNLTLQWTYGGASEDYLFGDGTATGDLDGDGFAEIVQKWDFGGLVVLNHDGTLRWEKFRDWARGYPAVVDLEGDGDLDIVEFQDPDSVVAYDGDGNELWRNASFRDHEEYNMGPSVADLDGDGTLEVVVTTQDGVAASLDAATGDTNWRVELIDFGIFDVFAGNAAVGDIDQDGSLEIVSWCLWYGHLIVLNGEDGSLQWASPNLYDLSGDSNNESGLGLADLEGDGLMEITLVSDPGAILVFEHDGTLRFRTEVSGAEGDWFQWSPPALGDVNGDGELEIIAYGAQAVLHVVDASGTELWRRQTLDTTGRDAWFGPGLTDLDGDGLLDIIVADFETLWGFKGDGTILFEEPLNALGFGAEAYPTVVIDDLDRDGLADLLVPGYGDDLLYSYSLDVPFTNEWQYMGTLLRTGTVGASSPAAALANLLAAVASLGLPSGFEIALSSKLENALASIEASHTEAAAGQLGAFIHQVEEMSGKDITVDEAAALIAAAQAIISAL